MIGQPIRFLAVGTAGYVVNLLIFVSLLDVAVAYVAASVFSYLVSNAVMYIGNRYLTFRLGRDGFWMAYARYLAVGLVVLGLNALVLAALVELGSVNVPFAQALALLAVTPIAFVLFKRWTFRV